MHRPVRRLVMVRLGIASLISVVMVVCCGQQGTPSQPKDVEVPTEVDTNATACQVTPTLPSPSDVSVTKTALPLADPLPTPSDNNHAIGTSLESVPTSSLGRVQDETLVDKVSTVIATLEVEGFNEWLVLQGASDIPYEGSDRKDPADLKDVIHAPTVRQDEQDGIVVILYTWTEDTGVLACWEVTIEDEMITFLHAEIVDTLVGHVSQIRTEGSFLPRPGKILIHEGWQIPLP